jgi:hypothetical protein
MRIKIAKYLIDFYEGSERQETARKGKEQDTNVQIGYGKRDVQVWK